MWVAYAPLSTEVSIFYCDGSPDCEVVSWTSQIFQAGGFLFGILGMYITDKYGVKVSVSSCTMLLYYFITFLDYFWNFFEFCWRSNPHHLIDTSRSNVRKNSNTLPG